MRRILCLLLLIASFSNAQQQFNVPFRVGDLYVFETPTDGVGTFVLTSQSQYLINTLGYNTFAVSFFTSYPDAQNNVNPIANPFFYTGFNFEQIYLRALDANTGFFYITSFRLFVQEDGIVEIPDANFKSALLTNMSAATTAISPQVDTNGDGELQYSEADAVLTLNLGFEITSGSITDLTGIEALGSLRELRLDDNQFSIFNSSGLSNMVFLKKLYARHCNINAINVSSLINLRELELQTNSISTIDVSTLTNLTSFACSTNPLTGPLNINNLVNLTSLKCSSNNLTTLDLSHFPKLWLLQCNANQLTTLDASHNLDLHSIECRINNLSELNLKNGIVETTVDFSTNPNLAYICVDEAQTATIQNQLNSLGMNATVSHTYCTFTPGGNYNTINGTVTFDANNNGCDSNDIFQPNIRINIVGEGNTGANFTSLNGNYEFYTLAGNYAILPAVENQNLSWFNFSPDSAIITFPDNNNNIDTRNFCLSANGIHPDVEVVISPLTTARPGFDAQYLVVYRNKGNQTLSGDVSFLYDEELLDFVSSDVTPTSQSLGTLNYDYTNLLPFESRSFRITLNVNTPTDSPPVNIGDTLSFAAAVNPMSGDENPPDNEFQYNQMVIGSFDPNDINCVEGNVVAPSQIGNYLHYIINFENTGNADAENIVVREVIDPNQFDVNSLQLMNSSAPVTARLTNNVAEFIFPNINLHSGGHGNILIKIKTKNTLVAGDAVSKKASIYFDYNFPVDTAPENTVFQSLNNPDIPVDASILIYPNPTIGNVAISCDKNIKSVQVYDVQGRLLQTELINQANTTLDLSGQSNGVYFLKVVSDEGMKVQKIIIE